MARFERSDSAQGPVVQGFAPDGGFAVEGAVYEGVLLTPQRAEHWNAPALDALTAEALAPLIAMDPAPEFLLLGTGARLRRPPADLVASLEARDIGVEVMDSRAAARTWGLLRSEERWIAAALMPLG